MGDKRSHFGIDYVEVERTRSCKLLKRSAEFDVNNSVMEREPSE